MGASGRITASNATCAASSARSRAFSRSSDTGVPGAPGVAPSRPLPVRMRFPASFDWQPGPSPPPPLLPRHASAAWRWAAARNPSNRRGICRREYLAPNDCGQTAECVTRLDHSVHSLQEHVSIRTGLCTTEEKVGSAVHTETVGSVVSGKRQVGAAPCWWSRSPPWTLQTRQPPQPAPPRPPHSRRGHRRARAGGREATGSPRGAAGTRRPWKWKTARRHAATCAVTRPTAPSRVSCPAVDFHCARCRVCACQRNAHPGCMLRIARNPASSRVPRHR